jgi:hypothetical protein
MTLIAVHSLTVLADRWSVCERDLMAVHCRVT